MLQSLSEANREIGRLMKEAKVLQDKCATLEAKNEDLELHLKSDEVNIIPHLSPHASLFILSYVLTHIFT